MSAPENIFDVSIYAHRPVEGLVAAVQHVRLDAMEHNVDNRKYNVLPTNGNKENKRCGMGDTNSGEELSDLGMLCIHLCRIPGIDMYLTGLHTACSGSRISVQV